MTRFESVLDEVRPAAVLVVGDVNSTLAASLVAVKKDTAVIHVEAGLRSFDRSMPEEINRVLTDQISDLLLTTEKSARRNLLREGVEESRIHFVGNVMIDTLQWNLEKAVSPEDILIQYGVEPRHFLESQLGYGVVTMHRPSNVDEPLVLGRLMKCLHDISERLPLVFAVHPRTEGRLSDAGLSSRGTERMLLTPPLGYLEMLGLMSRARLVMTDSGGMQEETTALGIPCLTLRSNTERPVTVEEGTNTIVGSDPQRIHRAVDDILTNGGKAGRVPELWDGRASERIKTIIVNWLRDSQTQASETSQRKRA
jgi:UDP-N-acetylglucosamine 2-epimerase (non-hydrolysing)